MGHSWFAWEGGVENRSVMVHNKKNGRWGLQGLMKHNELWDMGHLMPMKKEAY